MAKQRTIDAALAALYQVLAEGLNSYPDDEDRLRAAVEVLQKAPRRG